MSRRVRLQKKYVPMFRGALAAVADPVAAAAATEGEITCLHTLKITRQYLGFYDGDNASRRPAQYRKAMRQHRDAIRPYLGKRVLIGHVFHAGRGYEAQIDMETGAVITLWSAPWQPPGAARPTLG
jgi:hypothetical protein